MSGEHPRATPGNGSEGFAFAGAALLGMVVWSGQLRITDLPAIGDRLLDIVLPIIVTVMILAGLVTIVVWWRRRRAKTTTPRLSRVRAWWFGLGAVPPSLEHHDGVARPGRHHERSCPDPAVAHRDRR